MGRDTALDELQGELTGFNPRARVGRDGRGKSFFEEAFGFNPRARVGRDITADQSRCGESMFQSTRPRGARRSC